MLFLLILCVILLFYVYVKKRASYWKKRGIVSVDKNYYLNFMIGRRSLEQVNEALYKIESKEPYFGVNAMFKPMLFVRDPEFMHRVLVEEFGHFHERREAPAGGGRLIYSVDAIAGDRWKIFRNKVAPAFSASKLKKMYPIMEELAQVLVEERIRPFVQSRESIELKEISGRFALDVLGKCAFGLEFNTLKETRSPFWEMGTTMEQTTGLLNTIRTLIWFLNRNLLKFVGTKATSDSVEGFFFDILQDAMKVRRKESERRQDFLQLMWDAVKDNNALFDENYVASNLFMSYVEALRGTSNVLAFALYELTLRPEIQQRLREEIKNSRDTNDGTIDYDVMANMVYLDMVVSETLRLHPSIDSIVRMCTKTYQIPGTLFEIKPGEKVIYSISSVHKDEKYFSDPLKFDPERFAPENKARLHPHAYQPFGSGPRFCLGYRFATLEIKIALVSIISRFKLLRSDKTEEPITLKNTGFFHIAQNGIWVTFEEL